MTDEMLLPKRYASNERVVTFVLHGIFFLTGVGTVVLGPLLPALSLRWGIGDESAGRLLGAQFLGAFLGAVTLRSSLRKDLAAGCAAVVFGLACIAAAASSMDGFGFGVCGFLLAGFGLGRTITSINLIAGARFVGRRASAFALLNLTWGLGALACPVVAESVARRFGIAEFYALLMAVNAVVMLYGFMLLRRSAGRDLAGKSRSDQIESAGTWRWLPYALAFLAYGGIEASLSGWTTSLAIRSVGATFHLAAGVTMSLWVGMTVGRGAAAVLFLRVRERAVLVGALLLSGALTLVLLQVRTNEVASLILVFGLGVSLAPVFPALCSLLMVEDFSTGRNGRALAATALGSAIVPWMVGIVSERAGALQHGLLLPVGLCVLLAVFVRNLGGGSSPGRNIDA
jgi:FHS family glucose/mannose:H+ symporter-like MFS transporter